MNDSNNKKVAKHGRRDFLRIGLLGAAAAVPLITLAPKDARAAGSWIGNRDPNDPYSGAVVGDPLYGSWEWRQQKVEYARQQEILRARYGGLGTPR